MELDDTQVMGWPKDGDQMLQLRKEEREKQNPMEIKANV
jgi:hypothetical protein